MSVRMNSKGTQHLSCGLHFSGVFSLCLVEAVYFSSVQNEPTQALYIRSIAQQLIIILALNKEVTHCVSLVELTTMFLVTSEGSSTA